MIKKKKKKKMPEKITAQQIGWGVKAMLILIPAFFTASGVIVSVTWISGQTVEKVQTLEKKIEDTVRVKEQTAVDIAVIKEQMKKFDEFKAEYKEDIRDLKDLIKKNP